MKKYILLVLASLLLFGLTFLVATNYFNDTKEEIVESEIQKINKLEKIAELENVTEVSYEEEKISQNTNLVIVETYSDCNHEKEVNKKVDTDMVSLNKDEFKKKYPEYNLRSFSRDEVVVEKQNDGICNEHFRIGIGEDFIEVFKLRPDGDEELYLVTSIGRDYLAEEDIKKLDKGIEVYGKENINLKLEDYE